MSVESQKIKLVTNAQGSPELFAVTSRNFAGYMAGCDGIAIEDHGVIDRKNNGA